MARYPGGWFGESWFASVCDDVDYHLDVPIGELCIVCLIPFQASDQGLAIPYAYEVGNMSLTYEHIQCFRRMTLGVL